MFTVHQEDGFDLVFLRAIQELAEVVGMAVSTHAGDLPNLSFNRQ